MRLRLLKEGIAEAVATAQTATVQFQISPAYDKLSTAQLDGGLKRYFSAAKYVFCGSRIDIPIDYFLREPSFDDIGSSVSIVIKAIDDRTESGDTGEREDRFYRHIQEKANARLRESRLSVAYSREGEFTQRNLASISLSLLI